MGFRFRRSIRILPGVRLNLGNRSTSVSVGVRGAHVTLRPGRTVRTTVGLPGTGLSYTEGGQIERPHQAAAEGAGAEQDSTDATARPKARAWLWAVLALAVAALYLWAGRNH